MARRIGRGEDSPNLVLAHALRFVLDPPCFPYAAFFSWYLRVFTAGLAACFVSTLRAMAQMKPINSRAIAVVILFFGLSALPMRM